MINSILVSEIKLKKAIENEVLYLLKKKLNLKSVSIQEVEKLLNKNNSFLGIKKKIVKENNVYRVYVKEIDASKSIGKVYYEDSIIFIEGVSKPGVYDVLIAKRSSFWAKGKIYKGQEILESNTEEVTNYYLYNHHVILELYHLGNCGLFSLRRIVCVEKAPPIVKAVIHLWESRTITNSSQWKMIPFGSEDKFKIDCGSCDGSGRVGCNRCDGTGQLTCEKCGGRGSFPCDGCNASGYSFICKICHGSGLYEMPKLDCRKCTGTGQFRGGICYSCNGSGVYKDAKTVTCNFCKGNPKRVCGKCHGERKLECYPCDATGEIRCRNCRGCGVIRCPECEGKGGFPCHLKSLKHADDCDQNCSDQIIYLSTHTDKIYLDRQADDLLENYYKLTKDIKRVYLKKYSQTINEKILNDEFNSMYNYIDFEIQSKEEEYSASQKSIEYNFIETSSYYSSLGEVFNFHLEKKSNNEFKKADMVEIIGSDSKMIGIVNEATPASIKIRVYGQVAKGDIPASGIIRHCFLKTSYKYQKECIMAFIEENCEDLPIKKCLAELNVMEKPNWNTCDKYFDERIAKEESQKKCVDLSISNPPLLLIHGPPGTGKTTVIYEIIKQHLENPKCKVLMASQSNAAVDNVLEKLIKDSPSESIIDAVRVGREEAFTLPEARDFQFLSRLSEFQDSLRRGASESYEEIIKEIGILTNDANDLIYLRGLGEKNNNSIKELHDKKNSLTTNKNLLDETISLILIDMDTIQKLTAKIQKSQNNLLFKSLYKVQSILKKDPETKLIGVSENLRKLKYKKENLNQVIAQFDQQIGILEDQLNVLNVEISKYPEAYANLAKNNVNELARISRAKSAELKRKEIIYSLLTEWNNFIETGRESLANYLRNKANLIFSTCIGIHGDEYFNSINFDLVIIDESSRSTLREILVPMIRGNRFILVGDHLQLPPTVSRRATELCRNFRNVKYREHDSFESYWNCLNSKYCKRCYLNKSFIEELQTDLSFSDSLKVKLETQFRMHPDIADFISNAFYEGTIKNGCNTKNKRINLHMFPRQIYLLTTEPYKEESLEQKRGFGKENILEANKVCEVVAAIAKELPTPATLGLLSFYKAQVEKIKEQLKINDVDMSMFKDTEIASLDSFQGKQKDIIIISFVRSPKNAKLARLDFVLEFRRLNVALSRASKKLIIIGNIDTLGKFSRKMNTRIDIIRELIDYVKSRGSKIEYWERFKNK